MTHVNCVSYRWMGGRCTHPAAARRWFGLRRPICIVAALHNHGDERISAVACNLCWPRSPTDYPPGWTGPVIPMNDEEVNAGYRMAGRPNDGPNAAQATQEGTHAI